MPPMPGVRHTDPLNPVDLLAAREYDLVTGVDVDAKPLTRPRYR